MTFPNNALTIGKGDGLRICFSAREMIQQVAKTLPKDIRIPDSEKQFWSLKRYNGGDGDMSFSAALGIPNEYDWTYWSEYGGAVFPNSDSRGRQEQPAWRAVPLDGSPFDVLVRGGADQLRAAGVDSGAGPVL